MPDLRLPPCGQNAVAEVGSSVGRVAAAAAALRQSQPEGNPIPGFGRPPPRRMPSSSGADEAPPEPEYNKLVPTKASCQPCPLARPLTSRGRNLAMSICHLARTCSIRCATRPRIRARRRRRLRRLLRPRFRSEMTSRRPRAACLVTGRPRLPHKVLRPRRQCLVVLLRSRKSLRESGRRRCMTIRVRCVINHLQL